MTQYKRRTGIDRRQFLKGVGAVAGTAMLTSPFNSMTGFAQGEKVLRAAL